MFSVYTKGPWYPVFAGNRVNPAEVSLSERPKYLCLPVSGYARLYHLCYGFVKFEVVYYGFAMRRRCGSDAPEGDEAIEKR